ncbi:dihydrolipoamide acetyltransferase family protein [Mycobacterium sp. AT1]|uniref:dihydrolipoamide acetyltransferase family protein n=1 Tax=Mycobacterium sp. AT1 TaxID=1961706 RepID=UPI0009AD7F19|nr:dihydrolipoamide acetyltransferase family protein [Mycobacterium sp. AT1]OPX13345.1 branched-chain alpha-keto acid dehydrogenase subunit E2 [Mycobacterium sp. AT1]
MNEQIFLLPDLGEGLTEADIVDWKVQVGETVAIDQVVVEVETAKASVEVPIPFEGTVLTLHGDAGTTVHVGRPLITIAARVDGPSAAEGEPLVTAAHEKYRTEERAGSGNVLIGYGTSEETRRRRRRVTPNNGADGRIAADSPVASSQSSHAAPTRVISPLVRKLARENGIDVAVLSPSAPGGVITRADVERALPSGTPPVTLPRAAAIVDTGGAHREVRVPIKGLRKVVADKLSTSRREIPDATTWVDVDASELLSARRSINAALPDDEKIGVLALLARLALTALTKYPELNSTVDTTRDEIVQFGHVHLGIAAQTPRGLIVPVIQHADSLTTVALAQQLRETTRLAKEGKVPPSRLSGGTFTLNNYGVFGVDGSSSIINHPEAAILGVGRIIDKPWVVNGELSVRKVTQISLSFDHRVCDGGAAGGFLRLFADYVENPVAALGRL